ncbi:hypothetical protein ABEF95_008702 [Exophiala dermatitidis]
MDTQSSQTKQPKEKKLHELLTSSLVDIYVGPDSTRWTLHEKLLCHHSPLFDSIFNGQDKNEEKKSRGNKSYSLEDEDDESFELLVGWLYSQSVQEPKSEKDIGPLLELYTLSERLQIRKLGLDIVDLVREWYHKTSTYPGLRRVQYIYAETDEDNEMREMMVSSVARQLTTSDKIPSHWASALQRNGQLAVDIIRAIQQWHIEERSIPDARDLSTTRGRQKNGGDSNNLGFSEVDKTEESSETKDNSGPGFVNGNTNGNGPKGVNASDESATPTASADNSDAPNVKSEEDGEEQDGKEEGGDTDEDAEAEDDEEINSRAQTLALRPPVPRVDPPDKCDGVTEAKGLEVNTEMEMDEQKVAAAAVAVAAGTAAATAVAVEAIRRASLEAEERERDWDMMDEAEDERNGGGGGGDDGDGEGGYGYEENGGPGEGETIHTGREQEQERDTKQARHGPTPTTKSVSVRFFGSNVHFSFFGTQQHKSRTVTLAVGLGGLVCV